MVTLLVFAYRLGRGIYARKHIRYALAALGHDTRLLFALLDFHASFRHTTPVATSSGQFFVDLRLPPVSKPKDVSLPQSTMKPRYKCGHQASLCLGSHGRFQPSKYSPSIVLESSKVGGLLLILPTAPAVVYKSISMLPAKRGVRLYHRGNQLFFVTWLDLYSDRIV